MGKTQSDEYTPSGRQEDKPQRQSYTVVLACGCKLYYEAFPRQAPKSGDHIRCEEHFGMTTVVRVE